ncbi:MAG: Endonuclease/Exonuclease/phosphatase [Paramarteilia canceri]
MDILLCQEYEEFGNISYILQSQYGIGVHFAKFSSKIACADQYGGDGIATLFKTSKFEMLEKFSSTVADMTLLQAKTNPKQLILVANMHLKGPPFNQTEQLFQAMFVMHQINDKLQQLEKKYESKIELLIGGDLNCVPESLSRNFFAGNFEKALSIFDDDEKQTIASSLKDLKTLDAFEDKHCSTNYTEEFTGSIDHMFYDSTAFVPHIISQVSTDDLMRVSDGQFDKLPNIGFLSDHVPILAAFKRVQKT